MLVYMTVHEDGRRDSRVKGKSKHLNLNHAQMFIFLIRFCYLMVMFDSWVDFETTAPILNITERTADRVQDLIVVQWKEVEMHRPSLLTQSQ